MSACDEQRPNILRKIVSERPLFAVEDFSKAMAEALKASRLAEEQAGLPGPAESMRSVYLAIGHRPLWVAEGGITEAAELLLKDLDSLRGDGIDPARYNLQALSEALSQLKKSGDLKSAVAFDTSCTKAWLQASRDLLIGMIPPRKADSLWFHSNDSVWTGSEDLIAGLEKGGTYPSLFRYRSRIPTYGLLRREYVRYGILVTDTPLKALKSSISSRKVPDSIVSAIITREFPWIQPAAGDTFPETWQRIRGLQERYGLAPTGKLDSVTLTRLRMLPEEIMPLLAANMERLRWMPQALDTHHILVNIPQMELFFRRNGHEVMHMNVVVGKPARQTPTLNADMTNLVFSPSWGVPPTILKKDVLPGISRRGGAYLARKGLQAYDRRGRKVNRSEVTAENSRRFSFRQPPGQANALGDIKFNLPNKWDIYLHDTPHREDFKRRNRAKSSGCVRVEMPREMAEFILSDIEGRERFDQFTIDSIIGTRKTRTERLKRKIPVHIVYLTAFEDEAGRNIRLLPDIYKKDQQLMAALGQI